MSFESSVLGRASHICIIVGQLWLAFAATSLFVSSIIPDASQ